MTRVTYPALSRPNRLRRGSVLIATMVCLVVTSMLLAGLLKMAMLHRRHVHNSMNAVQADWLVESGIQRAVSRIEADPTYTGEKWIIPDQQLGGRFAGSVEIRVTTIEDDEGRITVSVEARWPVGATYSAKRSKQITLQTGSGDEQP